MAAYYVYGKYTIINRLREYRAIPHVAAVGALTALSVHTFVYQFRFVVDPLRESIGEGIAFPVFMTGAVVTVGLVFFLVWSVIVKRFAGRLLSAIRGLDRFEWGLIVAFILFSLVINAFVLTKTSAFINPLDDGSSIYDVVFTTDSSLLMEARDAFSSPNNAQNDFRHLLFGIVTQPISMVATPLASLCYYISQSIGGELPLATFLAFLITVAQGAMFVVAAILIGRILRREMSTRYANLFAVLYLCTFSSLIFTMTLEQYAVVQLALVVLVYCIVTGARAQIPLFLAGTSLITSFAMFPFVLLRGRDGWATKLRRTLIFALLTCVAIAFFGQLYDLFIIRSQWNSLQAYAYGDRITQLDKLEQFYAFIPTMFFAPPVSFAEGGVRLGSANPFMMLASGSILLSILVVAIKNRNKEAVRVSAYWAIFSFLLLGLFGWGAVEHSMILYSSYFTWSYLLLLAIGYARMFGNHRRAGAWLLLAATTVTGLYNLTSILDYVPHLHAFRF
ncbi:hypothetical protein [Cohnella sp. GCM10027633]|uniref:hypothetical protein n=1 Tax=unclassified Cohnella TaxID=2636738 RepID=UPI00362C702B